MGTPSPDGSRSIGANAVSATNQPARKPSGEQFTVWVRLGFGFAAGIFLEDITKYEPGPERVGLWHRATLMLDPQRATKKRRK